MKIFYGGYYYIILRIHQWISFKLISPSINSFPGVLGMSIEQSLIRTCQKAPNCAGILHLVPMAKCLDIRNKTYFLNKNVGRAPFLKGDNIHAKSSNDTLYLGEL